MSTNITEPHRHAFQALVSGEYDNFALFSWNVAQPIMLRSPGFPALSQEPTRITAT